MASTRFSDPTGTEKSAVTIVDMKRDHREEAAGRGERVVPIRQRSVSQACGLDHQPHDGRAGFSNCPLSACEYHTIVCMSMTMWKDRYSRSVGHRQGKMLAALIMGIASQTGREVAGRGVNDLQYFTLAVAVCCSAALPHRVAEERLPQWGAVRRRPSITNCIMA